MAYQEIVSTGSIYKGRTSMWLYLFHRVTGVALFGYLLLHIISTAIILESACLLYTSPSQRDNVKDLV